MGAQWLSGRVLDSRPRGGRFKPHRCHCVVSLSKNINPSLELVQPRETRPFITERLLMGRKESNQTKTLCSCFCCHLLIFFSTLAFSKNSFRNTIGVSNSLDPDQDQQSVGPDLGTNCLIRLSVEFCGKLNM